MIKDVMELIVFIIYMYYLVLKIKLNDIINRIRILCVYVRECGFVFMLIICWYFVGNCL